MGQSDFSMNYFAALLKIKRHCCSAWEAGERWYSVLTYDTVGLHPQEAGSVITQLERRVWAMSHFSSHPMCSVLGKNTRVCSCTSSRVTLTVINNNNTFRFARVKKSVWWLERGIKWKSFQFFQKNLTGSENLSQKHPNTSRLWEDGGGAFLFLLQRDERKDYDL